jgi:hypothetical protein
LEYLTKAHRQILAFSTLATVGVFEFTISKGKIVEFFFYKIPWKSTISVLLAPSARHNPKDTVKPFRIEICWGWAARPQA